MKSNEEFYVGWEPKAPTLIARHVVKTLIVIGIVVAISAILFALYQKKFSDGNFEFGRLTEVTGVYFDQPVPMLKVSTGKNESGEPGFISIPFIGFGKSGAEEVLSKLAQSKGINLNQKEVTLRGTLLYNDGKLLMQIDEKDQALVKFNVAADNSTTQIREELGNMELKGEIVDPKCYFGVMKPGEGKPHKDCAIRCILGGIPPVLRVRDPEGRTNYYLMVGEEGEKINEGIKSFVAEPVRVNARVVKYNDWIVLYVKSKKGIEAISGLTLARPDAQVIACMGMKEK